MSRTDHRRFIPTRVGNSKTPPFLRELITVHPHACGELFVILAKPMTSIGSSPRVWGTLLGNTEQINDNRFIPTRVGNSSKTSIKRRISSVHPHACGELTVPILKLIVNAGSSPRVWGTRIDSPQFQFNLRFIPTRVGNSLPYIINPVHSTVHPHACGELSTDIIFSSEYPGSSPRVWGTLWIMPFFGMLNRFIPTRVGNSS